MVLFGDSQTYSKFTFSQPIFELMTAWTAAHKDLLNIKLALCTGDLVEHNGMLTKFNPRMKSETTNAPSALQWESVARAFSRRTVLRMDALYRLFLRGRYVGRG